MGVFNACPPGRSVYRWVCIFIKSHQSGAASSCPNICRSARRPHCGTSTREDHFSESDVTDLAGRSAAVWAPGRPADVGARAGGRSGPLDPIGSLCLGRTRRVPRCRLYWWKATSARYGAVIHRGLLMKSARTSRRLRAAGRAIQTRRESPSPPHDPDRHYRPRSAVYTRRNEATTTRLLALRIRACERPTRCRLASGG